jgi:hypothetical protein
LGVDGMTFVSLKGIVSLSLIVSFLHPIIKIRETNDANAIFFVVLIFK